MQEVCIIRIAVVVHDHRGPVPHLPVQHVWDPCRMRGELLGTGPTARGARGGGNRCLTTELIYLWSRQLSCFELC